MPKNDLLTATQHIPTDQIPARAPGGSSRLRSHVTLALCTVLHAFTHVYGTLLVPLYLLITADLRLGGVGAATMIVTLYGVVYNLASYHAGMLADRHDRKALLGVGLLGNALVIVLIGLSRDYQMILALAILGGLFGALFHPTANALVMAHYPKNPGMAIGLLGAGSGLGFFAGPQFAGWRAQSATWHLWHVASWQRPCIEAGVAGLVLGVIFLWVAREARPSFGPDRTPPKMTRAHRNQILRLACVLGFRDFSGTAMISLGAIYLQKALGKSVQDAGQIVGFMMLLGMIGNPLAVYLSPGRRRLPALVVILITAGVVIATAPLWPARWVLVVFCAFQTLQLGSYAVSDAAILERTSPLLRGRVVGLFLMVAGTFAGISPWVMGFWTDQLGARAAHPSAYFGPFGLIGVMIALAAFGPKMIASLGWAEDATPINPLAEISPQTLETGG